MIQVKMITFIVRKDSLEAKWKNGVAGFKADINFDPEWNAEDEHLIAAGHSMGSDLDWHLAPWLEGGLSLTTLLPVSRTVEYPAPRVLRWIPGVAKTRQRVETASMKVFEDIAIVGLFEGPGLPTPWLRPGPSGSRRDWEFNDGPPPEIPPWVFPNVRR